MLLYFVKLLTVIFNNVKFLFNDAQLCMLFSPMLVVPSYGRVRSSFQWTDLCLQIFGYRMNCFINVLVGK
jgi:hypothetical protein